tara:strand:+ start:27163 stop:27444 length:282 start_codon:yes stop_codon:yes gene_type:complete
MELEEAQLLQTLTELSARIEVLIEKQDELAENVNKIKEAVYNPDSGLYARLAGLDGRIKSLEEWQSTSNRITWFVVTSLLGLFIATLWRTIVG